jgi:gliding motility-associated-like protein
VTTYFTVYPLDTVSQNQSVCYGGTYTVNSHTYTSSGTYMDTLSGAGANGCDSIVTTYFTVYPLDTVTQNQAVCYGGSYTINSHTYTLSGAYVDTLTGAGAHGCDSIVTTNLLIYPLDTVTQNLTVCNTGSYTINSHTYSTAGTYVDTLTGADAHGCDSIVTTHLAIYPTDTVTQNQSVCYGGSYTINSHTYTTSGTYMDTLIGSGAHGCDSIVTTVFTVYPLDTVTQSQAVCYGGSYTINSHTYTASGTYVDTLTGAGAHGCDSIVTTNFTVYPLDTVIQAQAVCYGGTYTINSHTYTTSGTYVDTLTGAGAHSCDSIVTTTFTVYPLDTVTQARVACYGGSYTINSHTYSASGTYVDTLIGAGVHSCDSIVTTIFTVYPLDTVSQNQGPLCYGQAYTINGHTYDSSGTYVDTLTASDIHHCDSIVTTHLIVYPLDTVTQNQGICFGQSYTINGHTYSTSGTYIDTLVGADRHHCDSIVTTNLIVHPLPVIALGPNVTTCGGSVQINAGNAGSTFVWSDGTTQQIDTVSTSGVYTVTVTTSFGCIDSGSKTIYIKPAPVVNLGPDQSHCGGTATLDAGNPGDAYLWSTGATTETIIVGATNSYSVIVTDTASHCSGTDTVVVTFNNAPPVNLGPDTAFCGGSLVLTGGDISNTYIWSTGATTNTITVTTTGTYSVTVTYTGGCTATGTIHVTIYSKPNLGADVTDSICPFSRTSLYNYYQASGLSLTYSTPTPASVDTGTYTVIGTNANGCSDTALITITYRQKPNLGADKADSICPGYTYDLRTLYPDNGYSSYAWTNTPNDSTVGAGIYQLIVSNASGCTDTAWATITLRQKPNLGGNKSDSICQHYTYDLTTLYPNTGYTTYTWTNAADPSAVTAGTYQLIVTNGSGCTDTAYATITYRAQPVVTLPAYPNLCSTVPAFQLTGGSPAGGTYYINNVATSTFNPGVLGAGQVYINYVYTNASGCTDSASRTITIFPQPVITEPAPLPTLCTGSQAIDLNTYFSPTGGSYFGPAISGQYFYPSLAGVGTDSIVYIYTDQNGCMDTAGEDITVTNAVHVTLHTDNTNYTACSGDSVRFFAGGAVDYQFFVNGVAVTSISDTSVFITTTLQNHDMVTVVGSNACSTDTSDFIIIDVNAPPVANAGPDTTIFLGNSVILHGSGTGSGNLTYNWTPGTNLNFSNVPNPTFKGSDTTTFVFRVTDANGCYGIDSVTVFVVVPDNVQLPNLITPNGDGMNDAWVLNPKINLAGSHLIIFNRWGEKVYEANTYANNWKGTYMNTSDKLPDGTYYYVLTVPAQDNHTYEGPINILSSTK